MPEPWPRGVWKVSQDDAAHLIYAGKTLRHIRISTTGVKVQVEFAIGGELTTVYMAAETTMDVEAEKIIVQAFEENGAVLPASGAYEILLQDPTS